MSLTPEQKEMRRTGIGGSEIAAVLGESRFASPFDVWLAKTQRWEQEETEDMRRGTFLEDGIGRWYAQRYGIEPQDMLESGTVRHASVSTALCTPDRLVRTINGARLVSIKSPRRKGDAWGDPGTDQVPPEYLLQLQWEHLIVRSNGERLSNDLHLAALLEGELNIYVTQADLELQEWMLDYSKQWWARHVAGGVAPSLDGSTQAREWLKSRFPVNEREMREATPHELRLMLELEMAEQAESAAAEEVTNITNELKTLIGDAAGLTAPNGRVTWLADKNDKRSFRTKWTTKRKAA